TFMISGTRKGYISSSPKGSLIKILNFTVLPPRNIDRFIGMIHILPNNKTLSSPSYHEGAKRLFIAVPPFFIVQYRTQFLLNRVYRTLASEPTIVQHS